MKFDLEALKLFCHVMREGGFSAAARAAKTSQPRISQQIAKLEGRLGAPLFQRVGREIVPTPLAKQVLSFATPLIEQVSTFEESLEAHRSTPQGKVRYAMPESCQWTPHYRAIMAKIAAYPSVTFDIRILPNDQIVAGLKDGSFDFGFVCGDRLASELRFEKFSDEPYVAVARSKDLLKTIETQPRWIGFPGWEQFLQVWAKGTSGPLGKSLRAGLKEPSVWIGTLAGAVHAVQEGAGVAILPYQCVMKEIESGDLLEWGKPSQRPTSPIHLCRRVGEKPPRRVELVIEMLREAKKSFGLPAR